jgi:DNA polymerase-3 subunit beta
MKFTIARETLLHALQLVIGVVERRQTLPVLANILLRITDHQLYLMGTDLEVELTSHLTLVGDYVAGEITVPGRKFIDIVRSLPDEAMLEIYEKNQNIVISSGRSRFTLTTLPAKDFPTSATPPNTVEFKLKQTMFLALLEQTYFAMAQQDVRYFLNGLLVELSDKKVRTVATDGHRLALSDLVILLTLENTQVIVPRKGIMELLRLLNHNDEEVIIKISAQAINVMTSEFTFISRLIDGRFPDYNKVIPKAGDKTVLIDKDVFKQVLNRIAILSNEKYRAVQVQLKPGLMGVMANNPEQEQAEEEVEIDYQGPAININFNVNYLIDAITALPVSNIKLTFSNPDSGVLVEGIGVDNALYIVMPLRI